MVAEWNVMEPRQNFDGRASLIDFAAANRKLVADTWYSQLLNCVSSIVSNSSTIAIAIRTTYQGRWTVAGKICVCNELFNEGL